MNRAKMFFSVVVTIVVLITILMWQLLEWVAVNQPSSHTIVLGMCTGFVVVILFQSTFILREADGLEVYQFGTWVATYHSGSSFGSLENDRQRQLYRDLDIKTLPFDVGFFLWPFYKTVRFSTVSTRVALHASSVYTNDSDPDRPRTVLDADPTLSIRFATLRYLLQTMHVNGRHVELTQMCENIGDPDHEYNDTLLAKLLWDNTAALVAEALRAAGTMFYFQGSEDILANKRALELTSLGILAQASSFLREARILMLPIAPTGEAAHDIEQLGWNVDTCTGSYTLQEFHGRSVLAVDLITERWSISEPGEGAGAQAIQAPFIGAQNARAEELAARGSASRIEQEGKAHANANRAMRDRLGIGAEHGLDVLTLQNLNRVDVHTISPTLTDAIAELVKRKPS